MVLCCASPEGRASPAGATVGAGRVGRSGLRRPSFTRRFCEYVDLLHDAVQDALPEDVRFLVCREEAPERCPAGCLAPTVPRGHSGRQQPPPKRHGSIERRDKQANVFE